MFYRFVLIMVSIILVSNSNLSAKTVTGDIISDANGFYFLEAHDDGERYVLFDQANKDADTVFFMDFLYLESDLAHKVVRAMRSNQTVTVLGSDHDCIGLGSGLLIDEIRFGS